MEFTDLVWLAGIVAGTGYLLYRSFRSGKGKCASCSAGTCGSAVPGRATVSVCSIARPKRGER